MKFTKRIIAMLMLSTFIIGCFAISANADPQPIIRIGDIVIFGNDTLNSDSNSDTTSITGSIEYKDGVLTLDNATISRVDDAFYFGLEVYNDDVTVVVKGDCKIYASTNSTVGAILFNGEGYELKGYDDNSSLTLYTSSNFGIYTENDVKISNLKLTIIENTDSPDFAICLGGKSEIVDSTIKIGTETNRVYRGIQYIDKNSSATSRTLTISNSSISIYDEYDGIFADHSDKANDKDNLIKIDNSDIFIDDIGDSDLYCQKIIEPMCAIHCDGSVEITDSKIDLTSKDATGIYATKDVTIDGCRGKIVSTSDGAQNAIYADSIVVKNIDIVKAGDTETDAEEITVTSSTDFKEFLYINFQKEVNAEVSINIPNDSDVKVDKDKLKGVIEKAKKEYPNATDVIVEFKVEIGSDKEDEALVKQNMPVSDNMDIYNVTLSLVVDGASKDIGGENDELISVTYPLPKNVDLDSIRVGRIHGGKYESLSELPNTDGEHIKELSQDGDNMISLLSMHFSTYAIAYDLLEEETTAPTTEQDTTKTTKQEIPSTTEIPVVPATKPTTVPTTEKITVPTTEQTAVSTTVPTTEAEKEEVADTADNTAISTFVALGTLSVVGFVAIKKKED